MHNPLAPLGCPILAHENLYKQGIWSDHSIDAWNLGTYMEHHQAFNVYSKHTRSEKKIGTLIFKHKCLTYLIVTPEYTVVESAKILTDEVTVNYESNESEKM